MLPILDEVAGSMCSDPASSGAAGTLTTAGTGEVIVIGGEGLGAAKTRQNASKRVPPACTVLVHNLYIVDDICYLIIIFYFKYLLQNI